MKEKKKSQMGADTKNKEGKNKQDKHMFDDLEGENSSDDDGEAGGDNGKKH